MGVSTTSWDLTGAGISAKPGWYGTVGRSTERTSCAWFYHGYNLVHVQTCLMTSYITTSKEKNCFPKSERKEPQTGTNLKKALPLREGPNFTPL